MSTRGRRTRRAAIAIGNETLKGLRHGWDERVQILIEMPLLVIFVLLLAYTVGQGTAIAETGAIDWTIDTRHGTWLFIGVAAYSYTFLHLQKMFWRLLAEIQSGTLEQTYLSPLPSWIHVVGGRVVAAMAETAIVVGVMFAVTSLVVRLELHWRLAMVVPLALVVIGAAGLALIVAGITLIWKRIQMLNDLVLLAVFFFSGSVLSRTDMPAWAGAVGTPLFMTHTVAGLRAVMLDGNTLAWGGTGGLAWMLGTAVAWFAAGLLVFRLCEGTARRQGSLSQF